MGKVLLLGLMLVAGAAAFALDFTRAAKGRADATYSLSDHFAFRTAALTNVFAVLTGEPQILPPAPKGWTRHSATYEDVLRAYGLTQSPKEIEAGKMIEKTMLDALPGYRRSYKTYEKDGQIIVIDVIAASPTRDARKGLNFMRMFFGRLAERSEPFLTVDGVDILSVQNQMTGKGRLLMGQIDGLAYLSAASNADIETTKALLSEVDAPGLRKIVAELVSKAAKQDPVSTAAADNDATTGGICVRRGGTKVCGAGN